MKLIIALLLFMNANAQDTSCVLDGSLSRGQSFLWQQISGKKASLNTPDSLVCKASGLVDGMYVFSLTAKSGNMINADSVTVVVSSVLSIKGDGNINHQPKGKKFNIKISNNLNVIVTSDKPQNMTVTLMNPLGQVLDKREEFLFKGDNYIQLKKPAQEGVYILNFSNYFINISQKYLFNR